MLTDIGRQSVEAFARLAATMGVHAPDAVERGRLADGTDAGERDHRVDNPRIPL